MSREFKYKIIMGADTSGALSAGAALGNLRTQTENTMNSMAMRSGAVQMGFMGIERAAKGDITAIFGVAQAVKALWAAFANGNPAIRIITLLVMAIGLISAAYQKWKSHQDGVTEAMKKSSEAASRFQAALKDINDARNALNMDSEIKSLDQLSKAFDRASKAMGDMNKAEDSLRGERHKIELAGVDEREAQGKIAAGGDKQQLQNVQFNAQREREAVKYSQAVGDLETQKKQIKERIKLLQEERNAMDTVAVLDMGKFGQALPLVKSDKKVAALKQELEKMGLSNLGGEMIALPGTTASDETMEKIKEYNAALKENEQLRKADDARKEKIRDRMAVTSQELVVLENQQAVLESQKKTLDAEYYAVHAKLNAEEQSAQNALDAEAAQKRLNALKETEKELQNAILRAARETADVAEDESKGTISDLEQNKDYLQKKYAHQYKMVNDPVYRAAHVGMEDDTTKAEAQEQKRWEKKVKRAYDQRARGARSKMTTDTITANETGKAARQNEKELEKAQQEMATNIKQSTAYLKNIDKKMDTAISLS